MPIPLQYRLVSLEFNRGAGGTARVHTLGFDLVPFAFDLRNSNVKIGETGTPLREVERLSRLVRVLRITAVNYSIVFAAPIKPRQKPLAPIQLRHNFRPKTCVVLRDCSAGGLRPLDLRLVEKNGKKFFRYGYSLTDVSDGAIQNDQLVCQFIA